MPPLSDLLTTLHLLLLTGFVGVTSLLLAATLVNRLRVRHLVQSWRTGPMWGLPLLPALFIGVVLGFQAWALATEQTVQGLVYAGYLVGGVFWFAAVALTRAVYVTECGFIAHAQRISLSISWGQVTDYFQTGDGERHDFVFFYVDDGGRRRRFDLKVPAEHQAVFRELLSEKVDTRFDCSVQEPAHKRAMEE